jgi:hypothetical protein
MTDLFNTPTLDVPKFSGLQNKADPETVGLRGFVAADNINIDSSGAHVSTRDGQTSFDNTNYRGAYATFDATRCYAVTAAGALAGWNGAAMTLRTGFVGYPYWVQIGDDVFVGNENQRWVVGPDNVVHDSVIAQPAPLQLLAVAGNLPPGQYRFVQVAVVNGRESAPSVVATIVLDGTQNVQVSGITGQRIYVCPADASVFQWWTDTSHATLVYAQLAESLGEELRTNDLLPMPFGRCLAQYQGRLYCSLYDRASDQSVVFRSLPFWWDLIDMREGYKLMPGEVRAMAGLPEGLVVCTDRQIGAIVDDAWQPYSDYGVPPGQPIALDVKVIDRQADSPPTVKQCWIWSQRGVVQALPFQDVTPQFSPPVSNFAGAVVMRKHGDERLIVAVSPSGVDDNVN